MKAAKAIHPVTGKVEAVKVYNNRFKLKVAEFPDSETYPLNSLVVVCSICEQSECSCPRAA